jgi:hypothetical protein
MEPISILLALLAIVLIILALRVFTRRFSFRLAMELLLTILLAVTVAAVGNAARPQQVMALRIARIAQTKPDLMEMPHDNIAGYARCLEMMREAAT